MAKYGRGGAQVDLILDNNQFALGQKVSGKILTHGGAIEQKVNKIHVSFNVDVVGKEEIYTHCIHTHALDSSFIIGPNEQIEFPFTYLLPTNLLISSNTASYYFTTYLDLVGAIDNRDRDYITVIPPRPFERIIASLSQLGLYEKHDSRVFNGYFQEFSFAPTTFLAGMIEEIKIAGLIEPNGLFLFMEVDLLPDNQRIKREVWIEQRLLGDPGELLIYLEACLTEMVSHPDPYMKLGNQSHSWYDPSKSFSAIGGFATGFITLKLPNPLEGNDRKDEQEENDKA